MEISASVAFSFESGSHRHDYPGILHAGVENGAGLALKQEREEEQEEEDFEVAHRLSGTSRG